MKMNLLIKKLRKEKGYTQEQLAELVGVSLMTVRRWEWGNTTPNSKLLQNLAEVLGTKPEELLNGAGEEKEPLMNYILGIEDTASSSDDDTGRDISLDNKAGHLVFRNGKLIVDLPDTPENKNLYWRIVDKILTNNPAVATA